MEVFYPWLNKRELNYVFYSSSATGRVLASRQSADAKIKRLDAMLEYSQDRFSDLSVIFRHAAEDGVFLHFRNLYSTQFERFARRLTVREIMEYPRLSYAEKRAIFLERGKLDYTYIWQSSMFMQDVFWCSYMLNEPEFNVPKMTLESVIKRKPNKAFVRMLLTEPRIDPAPALPWISRHDHYDLLPLAARHPLATLNALRPYLNKRLLVLCELELPNKVILRIIAFALANY